MDVSARETARQLIKTIAQEHTLNGTVFGTKFESLVNNCLEILSNQLYEKSTHFLLELIQNADDNIYQCSKPSLSFDYKPGILRIDCNEIGFDSDNVRAICGISQSTKSGKTSDGEFIGEKGIGFKSVFKAADVVWIASNEFTFKFDRTRPLGVITPIWEEFPEPTRTDRTSVLLKLSATYEEETLVRELIEFDTNLLIFLRRVEEINIRVTRLGSNIWEKQISKTQHQHKSDKTVILKAGTETLTYMVRTHIITDLPQEIRRPNWPQTKILLAFPIPASSEQPLLKPQNVYAFLPIRNYGFKFLIQADFLLTASREEIESTLAWNRRIRNALTEAFVQSMYHFNRGVLKYVWPYYLPSMATATSGFFEPAIQSILDLLRDRPVFESCAGTMAKPSTLVHVPTDFCVAGLPFTLSPLTHHRYLSSSYPGWVIDAMASVGVSQLSPRQFLEDLRTLIDTEATTVYTKSLEWHCQLAATLLKLSTDSELMPLIQDLALVPLNDGTWTAICGRNIFFSRSDASLEIPSGIQILIVDPAAELNPSRRTLFTSLGVKAWEAPEICRLIVQVHSSEDFEPDQLSVTQLVSHAVFLHQAAWQPPKGADLWFVTAKDERSRGREMYISSSSGTDSAASRLFAQLEKRFPVMHGDYLKALASDPGWPDWLVQHLGLSRIPRLITPVIEPRPQPAEVAVPSVNDPVTAKRKEKALSLLGEVSARSTPDSFDSKAERAGKDGEQITDSKLEDYKPVDDYYGYRKPFEYPAPPVDDYYEVEQRIASGSENKEARDLQREGPDLSIFVQATIDKMAAQKETNKEMQLQDPLQTVDDGWGFAFSSKTSKSKKKKKKKSPQPVEEVDDPWDGWGTATTRKKNNKKGTLEDESTAVDTKPIVHSTDEWDFGVEPASKNSINIGRPAVDKYNAWGDWGTKKKKKNKGPLENVSNVNTEPKEYPPDTKDLVGDPSEKKSENKKKASQTKSKTLSQPHVQVRGDEKRQGISLPASWQNLDESESFQNTGRITNHERFEDEESEEKWGAEIVSLSGSGPGSVYDSDDSMKLASDRRKRRAKIARNRQRREHPQSIYFSDDIAEAMNQEMDPVSTPLPTASSNGVTPKNIYDDRQEEDTLEQASEHAFIISTPVPDLLFNLSEEFTFMLQECDSSDVLQLIRENWHHYAQWLEGAHMKWQAANFVSASVHLKNKLAMSQVRTRRGLLPANETVLGSLDAQLDQSGFTPVIDLNEPSHAEWSSLSYIGVLIKADIEYYLRCLISISATDKPDIDIVAHIYERIQDKYASNEDLIRAAFYSRGIVFVPPDAQSAPEGYWARMEDCMSKAIDIGSRYPSCAYLFQCLLSPTGDPIGGLAHTMTLINSASKLEDIVQLFREVNKLLKDVSTSKAALLLKSLQNKTIFPVINGSRGPKYDELLDMHDNSWFIADQTNLLESFSGVIPLLALSVQDLPAVEDLFRALRVEGRKLSKMVTSETLAMGQTRSDFRHSDTFRAKSPFIKALIPRNHPSESTIKRQISGLRVRIASAISQHFTLALPNRIIHGNPIPAHVTISSVDNALTLVMTEESATAECPSHELVSLLAETCGIKDQKHISLLFTTLSKMSMKSINAAFVQQGVNVEGLVLPADPRDSKNPYTYHSALRLDGMRMPSPFHETVLKNIMEGNSGHLPEGIMFGQHGRSDLRSSNLNEKHHPDRRLPMLQRIQGAGSQYSNISIDEMFQMDAIFVGRKNVQYLGETMIARLLQTHLGQPFDPGRDWTSHLRERAGHNKFWSSGDFEAPFTLREKEVKARMTTFLARYGSSTVVDWRNRLNKWMPNYHIQVAVSVDGKGGSFVTDAFWLKQLADVRIPSDKGAEISDVNILIRIGRAYSESDFALEVYVDPWNLVEDGQLTFSKNWQIAVYIGEKPEQELQMAPAMSDPGSVEDTLYLPWAQSATTGLLQVESSFLVTAGARDLYIYKHLPPGYMRLLYLLPGQNEDPLQAVLNHIRCNNAGTYHALSYVWGTDKCTNELITPDGIIPLTTSLYNALRSLRQTERAIMVWADAVCINQSDNEEKSHQIRLMPQIYQSCKHTYAFISVADPDIDMALETLMQVRSQAVLKDRQRSKEDDNPSEWPEGLPRVPAYWNNGCIPPLHAPVWSAIKALFALPYFRRVWIVQEIVAAPDVKIVCGKWLIDWSDFFAALQTVEREVQIISEDEGDAGIINELRASWASFMTLATQREWEIRQFRWSLLMLLEIFRGGESTLARDRLFALVGLASDGNDDAFAPNYDVPFGNVVLGFARAFVGQSRAMQLLYRAGLPASTYRNGHEIKISHNIPSWIPDWTIPRPPGLHDASSDADSPFAAGGPQPPSAELGPAVDELSAQGYEVDSIIQISVATNKEGEWDAYFKEIDTMVDNAALSAAVGAKELVKWKVPIAGARFPRVDGTGVGAGAVVVGDMKDSYVAFRKWVRKPESAQKSKNGRAPMRRGTMDYRRGYAACLGGILEGWRFVVTKRGYVGVVPGTVQVGDVIAVMKGGCVPFVVRRSEERVGRVRLLGECYMHGIMRGEGIWLPGVEEKIFVLH